jgi:hypothetical protein
VRWGRPALAVLLLSVALAACGGGSSTSPARAASTTTTTATTTTTTVHSTTAPPPGPLIAGPGRCIRATPASVRGYLGLTLTAAQARTASEQKTVRVVGQDGSCALVTQDYSASRVDVELAHGVVIAAEIG